MKNTDCLQLIKNSCFFLYFFPYIVRQKRTRFDFLLDRVKKNKRLNSLTAFLSMKEGLKLKNR